MAWYAYIQNIATYPTTLIFRSQGASPATVAEWTLGKPDYYDVSLVDGFNIPMSVVSNANSCGTASCSVDLNPICPAELQLLDVSGKTVGCKSGCLIDTNPSKRQPAASRMVYTELFYSR